MTTESKDSTTDKATAATERSDKKFSAMPGVSVMPGGAKQKISAAEHWLLVSEKAYAGAQKQGFVGGDGDDFRLEAEKEVDAMYDTDFEGVFTETDAEKLTEQVKSVFGGFGLGHLGLDSILQKHREGLSTLA